ncbi:sulfotransferase [Rhodovulum sp. MB263]|uniref:sulfotransferase n=1 Tax=Rhodovulum sp. (strain MB263) TaxID=308754 RepID=UPI0018C88B09|nr:sulfotransferase [Rhodovulum sp. MB263]
MTLPDFFIIGAAKAGTTSIFALLEQHPDIFMPTPKEPEFFARDDLYSAGIETYSALFAGAGPGQRRGEASTLYSHAPLFPDTAARIARHVPEAQFIYVLREPVARAYSFYVQLVKNYQNGTRDYAVHRSFEDFVLPERHALAAPREKVLAPFNAHFPDTPELCLAGSDYLLQIETYLAQFPRERFLFLSFEAFRNDPRATLRRITGFLGLDPLPEAAFGGGAAARNVSRAHFDQLEAAAGAQRLRGRVGPLWALRRLLPDPLRAALRRRVLSEGAGRAHEPPPMEPATRQLLAARFHPQIPRLEELTGLSLASWQAGRLC